MSLSSHDEVPHIFTRKSHLQPGEFLVTSAKRLLQQNRPTAALSNRSKTLAYSMTSSARASSDGGTSRPSSYHCRSSHSLDEKPRLISLLPLLKILIRHCYKNENSYEGHHESECAGNPIPLL